MWVAYCLTLYTDITTGRNWRLKTKKTNKKNDRKKRVYLDGYARLFYVKKSGLKLYRTCPKAGRRMVEKVIPLENT